MNTYEIEGRQYFATNEYNAVKQAYKMADRFVFNGYAGNHLGRETWYYTAIFRSGHAHVKVARVRIESDAWITIPASNPFPEEDRIFRSWYYKIYDRVW